MKPYSLRRRSPSTAHIAGWIVSVLVTLFMFLDGVMKLVRPAQVVSGFAQLGMPVSAAAGIGIAVLVSALLYAYPRTSALGAILLTGFLGGATAIVVRVGQPFYFPVIFGVLVWAGLYLRDERLRALVPIRS